MKSITRGLALLTCMVHGTAMAATSWQPSDINHVMMFDGTPREYTLELFSTDGPIKTTVRASGVMEGHDDWFKAKESAEVITEGYGRTTTIRFQKRAFQDDTYLHVEQFDVTEDGKTHSQLSEDQNDAWMQIRHSEDVMAHLRSTMIIDALIGSHSILDMLHYQIESVKTGNGYTHQLSSNDDNPQIADSAIALLPGRVHVLRMKVDTGADGSFHYGRIYTHGETDHGSWAAQIDTQNFGSSVYLEVPTNVVPVQGYSTEMSMHEDEDVVKTVVQTVVQQKPSTVSKVETQPSTEERYNRRMQTLYREYHGNEGREVSHTALRTQEYKLPVTPGQSWSEVRNRYENRRYNEVTDEFEQAARQSNIHKLKTLIHRDILMRDGSDAVEAWLKNEVIPFFRAKDPHRSDIVHGVYTSVDEKGRLRGSMVERSVPTANGNWKNYLVLMRNQLHRRPGIVDVMKDVKAKDLGVSVRRAALDVPISSSLYKTDTEEYQLSFDNRGWTLAEEVNGERVYLLPGQTTEDAEEMLLQGKIDNTDSDLEFEHLAMAMHITTMNTCGNTKWNLLSEESNEDTMIFEWTSSCERYGVHGIGAITRGRDAYYLTRYVVLDKKMYDGLRSIWILNFKNAHIEYVR